MESQRKIGYSQSFMTKVWDQTDKRIKIELSLLLLLCLLVFITFSWNETIHNQVIIDIETESMAYLDDTLHNAGAAFLIARALNATISVMQSFTITPFIGELSVGEILDPVNDIVERFSWVMLAVTVSIGIQKLLLEMGISVNLTFLIVPALLLILISLFIQREKLKYWLRILAYRLLLLVLLVRFAVPVMGLIGAYISAEFLAEKRATAMQSIEVSKEKISTVTLQDTATSPKKMLKQLQQDSQKIVNQIIKLITLFVFETILFPLLVLWGLIKVFGMIFYWPVRWV